MPITTRHAAHQQAIHVTQTHPGCGTIIDRPLVALRCRPGAALALACKEKGATKPCVATASNKQPRHDLVTRPTGIVSGASLHRERHGSRVCVEIEAGDQRDVALRYALETTLDTQASKKAIGGSCREFFGIVSWECKMSSFVQVQRPWRRWQESVHCSQLHLEPLTGIPCGSMARQRGSAAHFRGCRTINRGFIFKVLLRFLVFNCLPVLRLTYAAVGINVALHAQVPPSSEMVVGSAVTMAGVRQALLRRSGSSNGSGWLNEKDSEMINEEGGSRDIKIAHAQVFYPFEYGGLHERHWDLVIIEGWFKMINVFIHEVKGARISL